MYDETLGGPVAAVLANLDTVKIMGSNEVLDLNLDNCEANMYDGDWVTRTMVSDDVILAILEVKFPSAEDLSLFGTPLLMEGIAKAVEEKTRVARLLTSRLS